VQDLTSLVRSNAQFSAIFVLSLLHMFLWVLLSPATTLVVVCAALHILFSLPLLFSAPAAFCILLLYFLVCVTQPRHTQRLVTQAIVVIMMGVVIAIAAGFVDYVFDVVQQGE
jgi:hypothetical protein